MYTLLIINPALVAVLTSGVKRVTEPSPSTEAHTGHDAARIEEQRQLQVINQRCREVINNLITSNHNSIRNIRDSSDNHTNLATHLAEFIGLVESQVPELRHDQPGWNGNYFRNYVDRNRAPQFICTSESAIVIEMLRHLQSRGFLSNLRFDPVETSCHGTHTAVGVSLDNMATNLNTVFILDPWLSSPGSAPGVFVRNGERSARRLWEERVTEVSRRGEEEERTFSNSFRGNAEQARAFIDNWFTRNGDRLQWSYFAPPSSYDHMFFTYYSASNSSLRFAIPPDFFNLMRDRIVHHLQEAGQLTQGEANTLRGLSIRDRTPAQVEETWRTFQPFITRYFQTMYAGNTAVQRRFPTR